MVKTREATLGIAIGQKGVGKTYTTLAQIQKVLTGNANAKGRKVLILDVNNEFGDVSNDQSKAFRHIKAIALKDVKRWCYNGIIEPRRVTIFKEGGGTMTLREVADALGVILDSFMNGLLLIEDITKFVSDSLPADLIGAICTNRHKSTDIIIHFQSVSKMAHPQLWANCNWVRVHKTKDAVKKHENKFAEDVTHFFLAEALVKLKFNAGDNRFYLFVDKEDGKVFGAFSRQDFINAINSYLEDNQNLVEKEVKRKNIRTGVPVHKDRNKAVDFLIETYIKEHYGNIR